MKLKFLVVVSLLFSCGASAQMKRLFVKDGYNKVFQLRDSLKAYYNGRYELATFLWNDKKDYSNWQFRNSEGREINFSIRTANIDADPVLEKKGVKIIDRVHVSGRFLDLFELYKHFIDPAADIEKLKVNGLKMGRVYTAYQGEEKMWVNLIGSGDNWELMLAKNK
jgi:hypothetical protein